MSRQVALLYHVDREGPHYEFFDSEDDAKDWIHAKVEEGVDLDVKFAIVGERLNVSVKRYTTVDFEETL